MNSCPFPRGLAVFAALAALAPARAQQPQAHENGYTVTLDVKIDDKGTPESLRLVGADDPSTGEILIKMAMAMAEKTKFPLHMKNGHAVAYTAQVPFFFPIKDDEGPAAQLQPKPRGRANLSRQPTYPPDLEAKGVVGGVILQFVVDTQGDVTQLTTLRASNPEFDQAATDAMKTWKFFPAEKDGKPIATRWRMAVVFESHDKMADLDYRIAPRPSLGSFIVVHDNTPAPAPGAPVVPAQPAAAPPAPGK